jgi:hypothetical protein
LKKYILVLILLLPGALYSQLFKSYGINFSYSLQSAGWQHPDTISISYHDKPYISRFNAGITAEFFSKKYYSTLCGLSGGVKYYYFEYDVNNPNGPQYVHNDITMLTLSVAEKLRYDLKVWSFYLYGGLKLDYQFHRSLEQDFESEFGNSSPVILGATAGIGFAKGFSKFWRITFDIYYNPDITKMINAPAGSVRNSELGFKLGLGLYNPVNR